MPRTKPAPFPFEADEIVVANESFVFTNPAGNDVFVHVGDRLRSSNGTVHRFPQWFCRDGEPLIPPDPPEITHKPNMPMKPARRYRSRQSAILSGRDASGHLVRIEVHEGSLAYETNQMFGYLSEAQIKKYFEEVTS